MFSSEVEGKLKTLVRDYANPDPIRQFALPCSASFGEAITYSVQRQLLTSGQHSVSLLLKEVLLEVLTFRFT